MSWKWKVYWLGIAVSYILLGFVNLDNDYEITLLTMFNMILILIGSSIIWILFITHVPKFCLKLLHDYIIKVVKENE